MTQIEAGQIENKILGGYAHGYALLMNIANFLYHDTIKGIANLNEKSLNDETDNLVDEYFKILNGPERKGNRKVYSAKLIEAWSKMLIMPLDFITAVKDRGYDDFLKVLGRAADAYFYFWNKIEDDFSELYERANDYVDVSETMKKHHEMYVCIMNDDVNYDDEQKKLRCFVLWMELMAEVFEKIEKQVTN